MRKLGICSLVLIVVLLVAAGSSSAVTRTVCASGPPCGTYTTINAAIAAASNGDVIAVKPGIYTENVLVNKSVRIVSTAGKLRTFVQATGPTWYAFYVGVPNVVISGFTVRGGTAAYGIYIIADNVRVMNCTVERSGYGIQIVPPAANVRLVSNQIRYCTAVDNASLSYAGAGILVSPSSLIDIPNVIISGNQIVDNDSYGIVVWGISGTTNFSGMVIAGNVLVNNYAQDAGVTLNTHNRNAGGLAFFNASGTITMNNNRIQDTVALPIDVSGIGTPTFAGTGNVKYSSCTKSVAGLPTTWTLP